MVDRASNELVTTEDKAHTYEGLSSADIHGIRRHLFGATKATVDQVEHFGAVGKIVLTEECCYEELGFCFPTWKKWMVISVIFLVHSLYSNGLTGISEEFGVSMQAARCGAMIFLVTYAFGCELWAPWSEELGRKPILQLSMLLVNIWQLPVALAPNFATIMVGRALGGLSLAGGSVTLGMVADMWDADTQQYAVACVVFSSVAGSVVGPLVGGFVEEYLGWRWTIWIQLIFGGFVQIVHLLVVPETRTTIMLGQIAKERRKNGENVYGPYEIIPWKERFSLKEICITWIRPFKMFVTEPIVLTLSLLSGFSDALIFMFIQSFGLVYDQWGFDTVALGLSFIPILVGYLIAWLSFYPVIQRNMAERRRKPDDEQAQYESRLWWLLYTVPFLPIGLIGFAWTSVGPPVHWMGTMVFSAMVGIANCSIYMTTIDYMVCAYDILAGILTIPATPFFENIGGDRHLEYASTILFCISVVLVVSVYTIYWYGPALRKRSPFAQQLSSSQMEGYSHSRRASAIMPRSKLGSRRNSLTYH
ncbi:MFS general substrate transporter [Lipomyces tetrasporus]|uniref:MFS general substrate transporter n=1 Tax=Lipomyces tetrasporus TaxID=54092 RepID=A0AAD7QNA0_9ASCO|nr:MFS general substrate transporter [Lipomyces tetrasporus]KAJ8098532.1 MFS general substrate transporter [Lipomyces tetrasporus]